LTSGHEDMRLILVELVLVESAAGVRLGARTPV
jgi:hypothetical protein